MRHFHSLLRYMKKNLNISCCVRRINMPKGYDGDCVFSKKGFCIRIEKSLPEYYAIDVLLHELAHCIAWNKEEDVHGYHWGKSYSKVYRLYLDWHDKIGVK